MGLIQDFEALKCAFEDHLDPYKYGRSNPKNQDHLDRLERDIQQIKDHLGIKDTKGPF